MGFLRIVINESMIITESDVEEFIEFLENLVENLKRSNIMISRLIIDYVDYVNSREYY